MDTHDRENRVGPQKESSGIFRGGPISQSEIQPKDRKYEHRDSNPYRLTQPSPGDDTKEQVEATVTIRGPGLLQQIKGRLFKEEPGVNNTKQKVMVILIPILFIIMVFMFRQVLSKKPQLTEGATNGDSPAVTTLSSDNEIDWQIPEPIPMQIRDPIKPGTQTTTSNNSQDNSNNIDMLSVRGILYSQDKPSAVIGNRIVHLNDKIDNATIVQIDRDFVVFEKNGKRWMKKVAELEMEQEEKDQLINEMETNDIQSLEE